MAIRLRSPLAGHLDDIEAQIDTIMEDVSPGDSRMTPVVSGRIRLELLRAGYDGLIVGDAGGDGVDFVIALLDDSVRVVTEE